MTSSTAALDFDSGVRGARLLAGVFIVVLVTVAVATMCTRPRVPDEAGLGYMERSGPPLAGGRQVQAARAENLLGAQIARPIPSSLISDVPEVWIDFSDGDVLLRYESGLTIEQTRIGVLDAQDPSQTPTEWLQEVQREWADSGADVKSVSLADGSFALVVEPGPIATGNATVIVDDLLVSVIGNGKIEGARLLDTLESAVQQLTV